MRTILSRIVGGMFRKIDNFIFLKNEDTLTTKRVVNKKNVLIFSFVFFFFFSFFSHANIASASYFNLNSSSYYNDEWGIIDYSIDGAYYCNLYIAGSTIYSNNYSSSDTWDFYPGSYGLGWHTASVRCWDTGYQEISGGSQDFYVSTRTYTVSGSAGANGSISPSSQSVNSGSTTTLTVTPNSGYSASASGCGGSLSGTTYTTGAITGNCTVTASFTAVSPYVTVSPGAGGTISPGSGYFTYNTSQFFTVTPNANYRVVDIFVNGVSQGASGGVAVYNIISNMTVSATFAALPYITVSPGAGGSISPTSQYYSYDTSQYFTVTPNANYHITSVKLDGVEQGGGFALYNITSNHTVTATFAIDTYTLSIGTAGTGSGSGGPAGSYNYGSVVSLTNSPSAGSTFSGWTGNADCTDGSVTMTAAVSCTANFTINQYTYTFNGNGATGNPSPTSRTLNYGAALAAPTAPTKTGYTFGGWSPAIPATMPLNGGTSTAIWNPNPCTSPSATSGTNGTWYNSTAPTGAICSGQSMTCTAGSWSPAAGSYQQTSCTSGCAATGDFGGTYNGQSVTGYADNTPIWPSTCSSATRTCSGGTTSALGTLSNSGYPYSGCTQYYTASFALAGGTPSYGVAYYYAGQTVTSPGSPTRAGYNFTGWSPALPSAMPASNQTYTAQWALAAVTFTAVPSLGTLTCNGGACSASYSVGTVLSMSATSVPGYTVALSSTGTANGCVSSGGGAGVAATCTATVPSGNTGVTATYTPISYTYTFAGNGATTAPVPASVTQNYATAISAPTAPAKTGYTFGSWSPAIPATMPVGGGTSTAQWNPVLQAALTVTSTTGTYPTAVTLTTSGGSGTGVVTYVASNGTATGCAITGVSPNFSLSYTTVGTCTVTATKAADANYPVPISSAATTITIAGAAQTATLTNTPTNYTGGVLTATASCSGGGTASIATGGTGTNAGSYPTTINCTAIGNYAASNGLTPTNGNFVISKINQPTLTTTAQTVTYPTAFATLATTGGGGTGGVTYVVTSAGAGCSIAGSVLSYTSAGTCGVTATKALDTNYNVASSAQATFTINTAAQTATLTNTPTNYTGGVLTATASCSGGGTASIATGGTGTNAGSYPTTINCTAIGNYAASNGLTPTNGNFVISKINQAALTVTSTTGTYPTSVNLTTSGGSGTGAVTYIASNGTATGCSIAGSVLSYTTAGTCTVTATKAADTNYNVVSSAGTTVTIGKATQPVVTVTAQTIAYNGTFSALAATGGAGTGSYSFTLGSAGTAGCSVVGTTLSFTSAGTCTVTAIRAADTNYLVSATSAAQTFTVNKATPTAITLTTTSGIFPGFTVTSTGGASNTSATVYSVTNGTATGCTINSSSGALTVSTVGTCNVTAQKATDTNWLAVSSGAVTVTISMTPQPPLILSGQTVNYPTTFVALSTTGGGGTGVVSYAVTSAGAGCSIAGTTLSYTSAGSCGVTATKQGDANYAIASSTEATFTINKGTPTALTITSTSGTYPSTVALTTSGGASNSSTPSFVVNSGPCTVATSTLTPTGAGTCMVTATKATDTNWLAVSSSSTAITIAKGTQAALIVTSTTGTFPTSVSLTTSGGSGSGAVTYIAANGTATGCSVAGSTLSYTTAGTCTVTATKAADTNYNVISSAGTTVTIGSVIPTLSLPTSASISTTGATLGATVTSSGGIALTARGTCFSTTSGNTIIGSGTCLAEGGTTVALFTHARTGMSAGTLYYYRGYATNATGTGYTAESSFYTQSTFTPVPGLGTLTCNGGACAASYDYGTVLSIVASGVPGYTVVVSATGTANGCVSSGGTVGTAATCTATVSGNTGITATYTITTNNLVINRTGTGAISGTYSAPGTYAVNYNSNVTITAAAVAGYSVVISNGCSASGGTGVGATCTITGMTSAKTVDVVYSSVLTISNPNTQTIVGTNVANCSASSCTPSVAYGTSVTLAPPALAGYTFAYGGDGTCTGTAGAGIAPTPCTFVMNAAKSVTATYTITTNVLTISNPNTQTIVGTNVASCSAATCTPSVNYGTSVTLTPPALPGYTFAWGGDGTCTGTALVGAVPTPCTFVMNGAKSVSATYTAGMVTITFDSAGGTAVDPITQAYNTAVTPPANPTKLGSTFLSWSPAVPGTMPGANLTVTAQWSIGSYTLTFDSDGGTAVSAITQNYGTSVTPPASPTKGGYTFQGWMPEIPATMPGYNSTIKALWSANSGDTTFGFTSVGTTTYPSTNIGYNGTGTTAIAKTTIMATKYTTTVPLTVTAIRTYGSASTNVKVSIYDHDAANNRPGNLLFAAVASATTANTPTTIAVPATNLPAGSYWLAYNCQAASCVTSSATTGGTKQTKSLTYASAFPNPGSTGWATSTTVDNIYMVGVPIEGYAKATKAVLSENATINSLSFYSHDIGNIRLAIYSDSSGPNTKLWESNSTALNADTWNTINISAGTPTSLNLSAATYWLVWQSDSANSGPSYTLGSAGDGNYIAQAYGTYPSTWTGGTSTTEKWSLYGTYTRAIPTVTSPASYNVTGSTATLEANVTSLGSPSTLTARGFCYGAINTTTTCVNASGLTTGTYTLGVTSLSLCTIYTYRGFATNATGTGYSSAGTFTTSCLSAPSVSTLAASDVGFSTITANGNITATGSGTLTTRGFVYDTVTHPLPGNVLPINSLYANKVEEVGIFTTGVYTGAISSLLSNNTYYIRAYACNDSVGCSYGGEVSPTTVTPPVLSQSDYGVYSNSNSLDVGDILGSLNNPSSPINSGEKFRLRLLLNVGSSPLPTNGANFKLQYAEKFGLCDAGFVGEVYEDITYNTPIAFYNNFRAEDKTVLSANASDPTAVGTIVNQSYVESPNFSNIIAPVPAGQNAKWDFSLYYKGIKGNTAYCIRVVNGNNALLDAYNKIPEISINYYRSRSGSVTAVDSNTNPTGTGTGGTAGGGTVKQCNDGIDNDGDTLIDTLDPGCHVGDLIGNSYTPTDDVETNVTTGGSGGGGGTTGDLGLVPSLFKFAYERLLPKTMTFSIFL